MRSNSHVPDGWRQVRLEDVAHVNPKRPPLDVEDDALVTFVPMAAVGEGCSGILAQEERAYHEVSKGYTYFEDADVLFAKITPCVQNGKHALASNLRNGVGFGTTEFHVVRAGPDIEPRHLFRVLTQPQNVEKCVRSFSGTAGQQRVQPDVLKSLRFLLPPLHEQRAIAAILDSIDEAIERTEEVIAATEHLRDALLHDLLTRGLPGRHTEYKQVRGLGTIPASWDVVRLRDVGRWLSGGTPSKKNPDFWSGSIPWVSPKDMKSRGIDDTRDHISHEGAEQGSRVVPAATILMVVRGMILAHSFPLAVTTRDVAFNQDIRALICAEGVHPAFMLSSLEHQRPSLMQLPTPSTHGTMRIVMEELLELLASLPPFEEQSSIANVLSNAEEEVAELQRTLGRLGELKLSVGECLLNGERRVAVMKEVQDEG